MGVENYWHYYCNGDFAWPNRILLTLSSFLQRDSCLGYYIEEGSAQKMASPSPSHSFGKILLLLLALLSKIPSNLLLPWYDRGIYSLWHFNYADSNYAALCFLFLASLIQEWKTSNSNWWTPVKVESMFQNVLFWSFSFSSCFWSCIVCYLEGLDTLKMYLKPRTIMRWLNLPCRMPHLQLRPKHQDDVQPWPTKIRWLKNDRQIGPLSHSKLL